MAQQEMREIRMQDGHTLERLADAIWKDPKNAPYIGEGHHFPTKRSLIDALIAANPQYGMREGHQIVCIDGVNKRVRWSGHLAPANAPVKVPTELVTPEIVKLFCPPPPPVTPNRPAEPPVPAAPSAVIHPTEYTRQSTPPTDGKYWAPGTELHALETLARTGLITNVTYQYYALQSIAGRTPVVGASDSGQVGSRTNGNVTSDHLLEGRRGFFGIGENPQSRVDDGVRDQDRTPGQTGVVGRFFTGVREHVGVTGHNGNITPDGTYVRDDDIKRWEFAHGGNYRISLFGGHGIPVGNLLDMPVGGVGSAPSSQYLSPAEARRWGISQAYVATSVNRVGGFDNVFSDEQAQVASPMETADRIYALTDALHQRREFTRAMRAVDTATTPAEKQAAAEHALIALRDYADNAQVKRVDSLRIPLDQLRAGVMQYFTSQGITVDQSRVASASRIPLVDMPQEQLESLQDYNRLKNSRYVGIQPGRTNAAYRVAQDRAHRTMNYYEAVIARGEAPELAEADMVRTSFEAHQAISASDASINVMAGAIESNVSTTIAFAQALADMPRNPEAYGFRSRREAIDYLEQHYIRGDEQMREQLLSRGDTSILNSILPVSSDDPYSNQRPDTLVSKLADAVRQNHDAYRDTIRRITDPALGTDRRGKSDGRRHGIALLQSIGSEPVSAGSRDGDDPAVTKAITASLDQSNAILVRGAALAAAAYAEAGASGRSVNAVQGLDNLYTAAQTGSLNAQGRPVGVATHGEITAGSARVAGVVFNTGAVDGRGAFEAARRGDTAGVYDQLFAQGREKIAVMGLTAHPALSRDAVLLTMLQNPHAFDGVIAELERRAASTDIERYGRLARALKTTREYAEDYQRTGDPRDRERAVKRFGNFFTHTSDDPSSNYAALRNNAWEVFMHAAGRDDTASAAIIDTARRDTALRDAIIKAVPDAITATDSARDTNRGRTGRGPQLPANMDGDQVYQPRFYNLPRDEKGNVDGGGYMGAIFGAPDVTVNNDALDAAISGQTAAVNAAPPAGTATGAPQAVSPAVAQAARGLTNNNVLHAGAVLNASPVVYQPTGLGSIRTSGNMSPVQAVAQLLKSSNVPLGNFGYASYEAMAEAAVNAGDITVKNEAGTLIATVQGSSGVQASVAEGARTNAAWGIDKRWLLLLLLNDGDRTPKGINPTPCPGCEPLPPPPPPTPPPPLPPGITGP